MAKKKRSGRRGSKKIPVLATAGAGIFALRAYEQYKMAPGWKGLAWGTLGIDNKGKLVTSQFVSNMAPLAIGIGASILASKVKANRYVSIPMFKF